MGGVEGTGGPSGFCALESANSVFDLAALCRLHRVPRGGVVHVGAHLGQELELYRELGFRRILLVEAHPHLAARLLASVRDDPRVLVASCAICDHDGSATLRVASYDESSSLLPFAEHREVYPDIVEESRLEVPARRLDSLLGALGLPPESFDLLVLDVQGAELLALRGARRALGHLSALVVEVSFRELYRGGALAHEVDDFLAEQGFERIATDRRHHPSWGDGFYLRRAGSTERAQDGATAEAADHADVHLLTQFYRPSWPERASQVRSCLEHNAANPAISRIHLFDETAKGPDTQLLEKLGDKLVHVPVPGHRLTFQEAVAYANRQLAGKRCVLANADVFFDETLAELPAFLDRSPGEDLPIALALLRHEVEENGDVGFGTVTNFSQDAWCFVPPIAVENAEFPLGADACDNRFAWELRRAGLRVRNPCRQIRVLHPRHDDSTRDWTLRPRVPSPYLLIPPELAATVPLPARHGTPRTPSFSAFLVVSGSEPTLATSLAGMQEFLDRGGDLLLLELGEPRPWIAEHAHVFGCRLASAEGDCDRLLTAVERDRLIAAFGPKARAVASGVTDHARARDLAARLCHRPHVLCLDSREEVRLDLDAVERHLAARPREAVRPLRRWALPAEEPVSEGRGALYDRRLACWTGLAGARFVPGDAHVLLDAEGRLIESRDLVGAYQPLPGIAETLLELAPLRLRGEPADLARIEADLSWFARMLGQRGRLGEAELVRSLWPPAAPTP